MEHILTAAGCSQLLLCLWSTDRIATAPALVIGILVFAALIGRVRAVLKERAPPPKRRVAPRKIVRMA
jgi:hypothetical protein